MTNFNSIYMRIVPVFTARRVSVVHTTRLGTSPSAQKLIRLINFQFDDTAKAWAPVTHII
jgi:hypothetical protein